MFFQNICSIFDCKCEILFTVFSLDDSSADATAKTATFAEET